MSPTVSPARREPVSRALVSPGPFGGARPGSRVSRAWTVSPALDSLKVGPVQLVAISPTCGSAREPGPSCFEPGGPSVMLDVNDDEGKQKMTMNSLRLLAALAILTVSIAAAPPGAPAQSPFVPDHGLCPSPDDPVLRGTVLCAYNFTGSIPAEIGNLTTLIILDLSGHDPNGSPDGNKLTGSIPPELGNLTNLNYLSLADNGLTGSIPPELGRLSNLIVLLLNDNGLTGSIPAELGRLSILTYLHLNDNGLTGSIPPELGRLSNLIRLNLYDKWSYGFYSAGIGQALQPDPTEPIR